MCEDSMCLLRLSPTRGRGNGGQDIYILRLISGLYLRSGESITTVPLDTFWNGMRGLVSSGVQPLISSWLNGSVSGLRIIWPDLRNCTQLVLDSDSMMKLQVRINDRTGPLGYATYYVPQVCKGEASSPAFAPLEREGVPKLSDWRGTF